MNTIHKNLLAALLFCAPLLAPPQAHAQTVVLAADMRRSEEAFARGDHVIIYGKENVKTYLYYSLSQLPFAKFSLQVEAAGESGDGRWPHMGLALDDTAKISKEIEINRADFQIYDLGVCDATSAGTLYLVFTNDYYNAATRADVNLKIRQAIFTATGAGPRPSPLDTFVVKGASAVLEWNPNSEADLAGYRVFKGLESGKYLSPIDVGNVTSFKFDLSPQYKYFFALAAYDKANNPSAFSKEVLVVATNEGGGATPSDLNGDGKCDVADQAIINQAMGSSCNGKRYNRKADLNQDCKVNGLDVILFSTNCQ